MFCLDDGSLENFIQLIDEQPCTPIRHPHRAPGCRNGTVIPDGFEQADLSMADRLSRPKIETQCEPRHRDSLADDADTHSRGWGLLIGLDSDMFYHIQRRSRCNSFGCCGWRCCCCSLRR